MAKERNWPNDTQAAQTIKVLKAAAKQVVTHMRGNGKNAKMAKGK